MYLPIPPQASCAAAWLAACNAVDAEAGHEAHNVIIGVADPVRRNAEDVRIEQEVDALLRRNDRWPIETVANTIFPQALYERHGSPAFYKAYMERVFPRIKRTHADWGRYFERMITFPLQKKGEDINPLQDLIEKMSNQVANERCFQNVYELTVYDPIRDAGRVMNRQCLSFLSFKVTGETPRKLLLTAIYRNHYYMERLLGNLVGLGRLMKFVADQAGIEVGDLTVVSTHAQIDSAAPRAEVVKLFSDCAQAPIATVSA